MTEAVELLAVEWLTATSLMRRRRAAVALRRALRRASVVAVITGMATVRLIGGRLGVRGTDGLWLHLAFRSDPLDGQFPGRPGA